MDLETRQLAAAYAIEGIARPVGLAVRGAELYVASADGRVLVVDKPSPPPIAPVTR